MITKKEVQHIAKLARLNMTPREEERFAKELSSILKYIEKLKEIDTSKVEPTSHPFEIKNVMRKDIPRCSDIETVQKLLKAAPLREKTYIKVKAILKHSE
ncbi:Asp-tRNA(Asn)/Glu-tRNA(Gln) amidotransferase subunit GatC [bacterium]|nr:Asp-tRNA(Asn)/Glu-tRNA(Gln) amidotransferase subunit GatC [bacterium]HDJ30356.1 Asp-tRNA(Asn)/Glu-tRNA(Gln) amidotransferase subunit GatC [bacterium]